MSERDLVFFCYSHEDARWLQAIRKALAPYSLDEKLKGWSDQEIEVGELWDGVIMEALDRTRVGVLLISQDFFGSRYVREKELPTLLESAAAGLLTLVCVPVAAFDRNLLATWRLDEFQLPLDPLQPLSARTGNRRERAVIEVSIHIKDSYSRLGVKPMCEVAPGRVTSPEDPSRGLADSHSLESASERVAGLLSGVPDLDLRHHVERSAPLWELKQLVLSGSNRAALAAAVAPPGRIGLHGMGGVGKTEVAQAVCHDPAVRSAFEDGIYWLTLGQQPDLLVEQTKLLLMLGAPAPVVGTTQEARALLRKQVAGKRVLLVVDDLWLAEHFHTFDVLDDHGCVLVTTRDAVLLTLIGAHKVRLECMTEPEALKLIAVWAGLDSGGLPDSARQVAELCGYLPLALALAGAQIADGVQWPTLIGQLETGALEFLDHEYGSVFSCLGRSIDALTEPERARYLELAVFVEDARIPLVTVARLWKGTGGLSEAGTEKLLGRLQRKAMLQILGVSATRYVSFHDLQYDLLRIRADSPSALSARLLDAYRTALDLPPGPAGWAALPADEPYLWQNLTRHLVEAGRHAELASLLLNFAWLRGKLHASMTVRDGIASIDVNTLLSDYDHACAACDAGAHRALREVQRALRLSAHVLSQDLSQLPSQLYGRLLNSKDTDIQALLRQVYEFRSTPWLCPIDGNLVSPSSELQRRLTGHTGTVTSLVLTQDGRRLISGSRDGTVRIWDLQNEGSCQILKGHTEGVKALALTRDGTRVVSASWDATLKVWDVESGSLAHTLRGHKECVLALGLVRSTGHMLSSGPDGTIRLWDVEKGGEIWQRDNFSQSVFDLAVTPDERFVLCVGYDELIEVIDLLSGKLARRLLGHTPNTAGNAILVTADGRFALSASHDHTVKIWDLATGELQRALGHNSGVESLAMIPGERLVLSGTYDGTLTIWDLHTGESVRVIDTHEGHIKAICVSPDGSRVFTASEDHIAVWNLNHETSESQPLVGVQSGIYSMAVDVSGQNLLIGDLCGSVHVWDTVNDKFSTLEASGNAWQRIEVVMTPDGRRAVTVNRDERTARLWDLERRIELQQLSLTGESYEPLGVAISADGRRAAFISGACVTTWDIDGCTELGRSQLNLAKEDYIEEIAMDASGNHVIVAMPEGLTCFDAQTHQAKRALDDSSSLWRFALSKEDGLIVGVRSSRLIFWHAGRDSHPVVVDFGQWVNACDCTPDGRFAVALLEDKVIRVWDVSRNMLLASFTADYALRFCAIASTGDFVVAAATGGALYRLRLRR